jgi:hypothetical protein
MRNDILKNHSDAAYISLNLKCACEVALRRRVFLSWKIKVEA